MTDTELMRKIAVRAVKLAVENGVDYDQQTAVMDIWATHESNPLRLEDLLKADDGNFGHDVFGIRRYMDRETGKLTDCFSPRYTK